MLKEIKKSLRDNVELLRKLDEKPEQSNAKMFRKIN